VMNGRSHGPGFSNQNFSSQADALRSVVSGAAPPTWAAQAFPGGYGVEARLAGHRVDGAEHGVAGPLHVLNREFTRQPYVGMDLS
jgi:hypothetical protein